MNLKTFRKIEAIYTGFSNILCFIESNFGIRKTMVKRSHAEKVIRKEDVILGNKFLGSTYKG